MFPFIESIKIENGVPLLLPLHQERIDTTFQHFGLTNSINLHTILFQKKFEKDAIFKCRLLYHLNGDFSIDTQVYKKKEITAFKLIIDNQLKYSLKSTDRSQFEKYTAKDPSIEFIFIQENNITDTTFSNLIFLKEGRWYTPETYLLKGVQRQHLLDNHLIEACKIQVKDLVEFSHFKIINALNGWDGFAYPIESISNLNDFI